MSPCFECYIRGKRYSKEGCKDCDYAIVANKLSLANTIIDGLLDILEQEHIGMKDQVITLLREEYNYEYSPRIN